MANSEPEQNPPPVLPEIRARRLVIVNDTGQHQATLGVNRGVVELQLGGAEADMPCELLLHAGEQEAGCYTAGVELCAKGNSIGGCVITVQGSRIDMQWFGPTSQR